MTKKRFYQITVLAFLGVCSSCSELDGTIEKRNGTKMYLVNNSKKKEFRFTIKTTKITNDSIFEYSTSKSQLAPGDELYLGNENEVSENQYPTIEKKLLKTYEIVDKDFFQETKVVNGVHYYKDKKDNWYQVPKFDPNKPYKSVYELPDLRSVLFDEEGFPFAISFLKDTVLNGKNYKYRYIVENAKDSLHPFPQIHYKHIFIVTGQVEIKNDQTKVSR